MRNVTNISLGKKFRGKKLSPLGISDIGKNYLLTKISTYVYSTVKLFKLVVRGAYEPPKEAKERVTRVP
jgi:hypothetical protein